MYRYSLYTTSEIPPSVAQAFTESEKVSLASLGFDYRLCRALWIVSLALWLYDYLLTLNRELDFMWGRRFVFARVLFFVTRYWSLAVLILDNIMLAVPHPTFRTCFIWFNSLPYTNLITHIAIGSILILRMYAIFNRNKKLLYPIFSLFLVVISVETVIMGIVSNRLRPALQLSPFFDGCIPTNVQSFAWAMWVPAIVFDTCLVILSVIRSFEVSRRDVDPPHILIILLRDSMLYFVGIILVYLLNMIVWIAGRESLWGSFFGLKITIQSILACRVLLNIQEAADPRYRKDILVSSMSLSGNHSQLFALEPVGMSRAGVTSTGIQVGVETEIQFDISEPSMPHWSGPTDWK